MRSATALVIPLTLALAACAGGLDYGGDRVHETTRQTMVAAGVRSIRVENVAGAIEITASNTNQIAIQATKSGNDTDAIARTHVDISRDGDEVSVQTRYDNEGGGWFSPHNGASVSYVIRVPARVDLSVRNVSGSVHATGASANVSIDEVSGAVTVALGRVQGSRQIRISSISGPIALAMAKDSDVRVQSRTVSGGIQAFFTGNIHKGFVGESLDGRLGSGSATMTLAAVSGRITITAQQ